MIIQWTTCPRCKKIRCPVRDGVCIECIVDVQFVDTHRTSNEEIKVLRDAIKKHRSKTGHEMCWENDEELWSVLSDGVKLDHTRPPKEEFMKRCQRYCDSRQSDA